MDTDAGNAIVIFFDGDEVVHEMYHTDFDELLDQQTVIEEFAASVVHAAYCDIGPGHTLRGIVFFVLKIDENGMADENFNVPLQYLVKHAGAGPDLGSGPIRVACRSQCSVPWHARDLWEPVGEGEKHPAHLAQKIIWRNRLGLGLNDGGTFSESDDNGADPAIELQESLSAYGADESFSAHGEDASDDQDQANVQHLSAQYADQMEELRARHRTELEEQQQSYLEQVRSCKDEIQRLKTDLRNEQSRNVRLQQLLRGDS